MSLYCSQQHANPDSNRFCQQCGEPFPLKSGEVLEKRYRVVRILGQGGFGRTYLTEDIERSQQHCVLKEFAPQVTKELLNKAYELFNREATVLQQLQHPQIPGFRGTLQLKIGSQDFLFLVQEYVDGETYCDLLESRKSQGTTFSEAEVKLLLEQMLPVLTYMHGQNVIHRDITPDNLMLRRSDNLPVLIDFGGVKQLAATNFFRFTQVGGLRTLLGKKGYAPEEQLRQGQAYPNSDLYSLAVTALVLLTGKEPPQLYDSYKGSWRWGEEIKVSPTLEGVLKNMLAYKPNQRYQTAAQVLQALNSFPAPPAPDPNISKIHTVVASPKWQPVKSLATQFHKRTQMAVQTISAPTWLRPLAISFVGTTGAVLIGTGSFALVNAVIGALPKFPEVKAPVPSFPKFPAADAPNRGLIVIQRRQQLGISEIFFTRAVDELFYAKNPDLQGKSLSDRPEDSSLRNDWLELGNELLNKVEKANLSSAARRKLGNYSQKDYTTWQEQANSGQLRDYSIEQLTKETDKQFSKLFPQQPPEKLKKTALRQIWYAIAADKVSQLQGTENRE